MIATSSPPSKWAWRIVALAVLLALTLGHGAIAQTPVNSLTFLASEGSAHNTPSVSADGRYVAFLSSLVLEPADTNYSNFDIYVRDRVLGTTTLISASTLGQGANGSSEHPSISADGRYVAFHSGASNLVADDTNNVEDIFVRDRDADGNGVFDEPGTSTTTRASVDSLGTQSNCISARPAMSSDGRFVAFDSCATNWIDIAGKTFPVQDVFVRDLQTGATLWVNPPTQNSPNGFNNHHSGSASIGVDGRYIAFASQATTQPQALGHFGSSQIYVRDTCLGGPAGCIGSTEWASPQPHVDFQPSAAFAPALSADARFVAFDSLSTALVAGDTNGVSDIFVFDRQSGMTSRINVSSAGAQAVTAGLSTCSGSLFPAISGNGRFVTFESCANNLVDDDTLTPFNFKDVFVHDRDVDDDGIFDEPGSITTMLVSRNPAGTAADSDSLEPAISGDGYNVVFASYSRDITPDATPIGLYVWGAANHDPVADAGVDQTIDADGTGHVTATLDGSASHDPDGDDLTFTWTGPFGTQGGAVVTPALAVGTHTVTLTVDDGRGGQATDTVMITVQPQAGGDLMMSLSAAPDPVEAGQPLNVTLVVSNVGVADVSDVVVTFPLPHGVTFASAVATMGTCVVAGSAPATLKCGIGTLATGGSAQVDVVIMPDIAGPLIVSANADGSLVDPSPLNNEAQRTVTVRPGPVAIDVLETIMVTDQSVPAPSTLLTVNEPIGVTDSDFVLPSVQLGIVEAIAVTDAPIPMPSTLVVVSETIGVADSPMTTPIVADTTPPVLTLPANQTVVATSSGGAVVNYSASALDAVDGVIVPNCAPASGATFAIGQTMVQCSATDAHGNTANGSFRVTVVVGVPVVVGTVRASGRDFAGQLFVDFTLTNIGKGHAREVRLASLSFLTLAGKGVVSYDALRSGALPLAVGALDAGASSTLRLYLRVPKAVTHFIMVSIGSFETVTGAKLPWAAVPVIDSR